jgi:hypothetical protein
MQIFLLEEEWTSVFQSHLKPQSISRKAPVVTLPVRRNNPLGNIRVRGTSWARKTTENSTDTCSRWSQTSPSGEVKIETIKQAPGRQFLKKWDVVGGCPMKTRKSPNVCQGSFDVMDPGRTQARPVNVPFATGEAFKDFYTRLQDNVCRSTHHACEEVGL